MKHAIELLTAGLSDEQDLAFRAGTEGRYDDEKKHLETAASYEAALAVLETPRNDAPTLPTPLPN